MQCRLSDGHSNDYFIDILEILTMTNVPSNANTSDATGRSPSAAEMKQTELSPLKNKDDLVTQAVAKYGLEKGRIPAAGCGRNRSATTVTFDYSVEAELFPARNRRYGRRPVGYRRFARAADAVRFAIEELPPELLVGAFLEVDGERYGGEEIRRLYDSADFPLIRRAAA
jgi:hypothetical protein